ncbi:MAG: ATP-binding protein [Pirellulaceae bacterium]
MATEGTATSMRPGGRFAINLGWLITLRWAAVVGQLVTIGVAALAFQVDLPQAPLLTMVVVTALTNLVLSAVFHRRAGLTDELGASRWQTVVGVVMLLDLFILTGLLYYTGGPANPFFVFYFVNLSLAAVVLPANWAWPLTAAAVALFAALFYRHVPVPVLEAAPPSASRGEFSIPQQGMLAAFATCAVVVVYFMTRLTHELRLQELALRGAESQRARSEKLEALGTLAGGAAHELATPLSTIAVVAKELEADAERLRDEALSEDVRLIRSEVTRCRRILDRLASNAGHATGEAPTDLSVGRLVELVVEEILGRERVRIRVDETTAASMLRVPPDALSQAIRGLVENALDAVAEGEPIDLSARRTERGATITIRDTGAGMPPEVLDRAGEPFFTTKPPGRGMGLGVFLARSTVERLGGSLRFTSSPGEGTTVEVDLTTT